MAIGATLSTVDLLDVVTIGDDFVFTVTITKNGATYDITGATLTMEIKEQGTSSDITPLVTKAGVITDATNGVATFTLTDTDTGGLSSPDISSSTAVVTHIGDIKVVESGGNVYHPGLFRFDARYPITG